MTSPLLQPKVDHQDVGVVIIGRDEGERLRRCLNALRDDGRPLVYVDSGSTDGSVEVAKNAGADVVLLDTSVPFTAARGRNRGFARLKEISPEIRFVQFVDGDSELVRGWLETANSFLRQRADVSCVCGRLRERFPERSIYNRLCDLEWNRPPGETDACGGIAMYRVDAFETAGGFRPGMIAGEEPDLCLRIRALGGRIWRTSDEMAWHDADLTQFGQWWRRAVRGGYALAEGIALHGQESSDRNKGRLRRVLAWGLFVPISIGALAALSEWWLLSILIYPLRIVRLSQKKSAGRFPQNWIWATFMVVTSFAEAAGLAKYWTRRIGRLLA